MWLHWNRLIKWYGLVVRIIQREWKTLSRFLVVGGSAFLVRAGLYAVLSRYLWPEGSRVLENVFSIACSIIYNYLCSTWWTFRYHTAASGTFWRFIIVALVAGSIDVGLFYGLHSILGIYDFYVIVFNGGSIALITFTLHRVFTYHANPWRRRFTA